MFGKKKKSRKKSSGGRTKKKSSVNKREVVEALATFAWQAYKTKKRM